MSLNPATKRAVNVCLIVDLCYNNKTSLLINWLFAGGKTYFA